MNPIKKSFQYGSHTVTFETGEIARQASGAVMVSMGETIVFVTAVGLKRGSEGRDFFPLTVDYQERTYAAGPIPGTTSCRCSCTARRPSTSPRSSNSAT